MKESTKKRVHEIEIIAAATLILVSVALLFSRPGITGYISYETKIHKIDLTIANSQSYVLTTDSNNPFYITSLKLSGDVIGDGVVKAYLSSNDQKILIYSNTVKKKRGLQGITSMSRITGRVIGTDSESEEDGIVIAYLENIEEGPEAIAEDEILSSGKFEDSCADSCFIELLLNKDTSYQLLFYIEEGTILNLNEIVYTVKKD